MLKPGPTAIGFSNISHSLTHLFMLLYPTAVLGMGSEFNLPYPDMISLSIGGFVLFGAGALPAGWLADKWSSVGMMALMLFGIGGASILTGLATSPLMLGAGLALIGLFASIYHPVGIALVVRHASRRGRALGFNGVFGGIGLAAGPFVAGVLMNWIDWRAAFIIPGAGAIGVGIVYLAAVRISGLVDTREDAHPQAEVSNRAMVSVFLILSFTTMCAGLIFQSTTVALPKIFAERMSMFNGEVASVGGLVTLVYLVSAGFQMVGGLLADRFPLKWVFVGSYVIQVPVLMVAASLADWPLLGFAMAMVLLQNGAAPAETAMFARYSPARWRATAFGVKFVIALGVSSLGVPLVAQIFKHTGGFYWLFIVMGALAFLVVLAGLLLPREGRAASVAVPTATRTATRTATEGD